MRLLRIACHVVIGRAAVTDAGREAVRRHLRVQLREVDLQDATSHCVLAATARMASSRERTESVSEV
jgi:hypothetical protein